MRLALDNHIGFAPDHEKHALRLRVGLGPRAATAGRDFHDILREGLGKAGHRAGNDPGAGLVPMGQIAGDDVAHHAMGDDSIGLGEDSAAGMERGLRGQAG